MTVHSGLEQYARQSAYSDPGAYRALFDALPTDVRELTAVVRNMIVHYRGAGYAFTGERLAEIDHRWIDRLLTTDQRRFAAPLAAPRPEADRVAGCCRDLTLLTVAALRHRGVPARSRVGFAAYFDPDFCFDHVIVEYVDRDGGDRWVFADAQLEPGPTWPFDPVDVPRLVGANPPAPPVFATAAQVWTAYRRGDIDVDRYGVAADGPLRGAWIAYDYVFHELAHRRREELLLWDTWGAMATGPDQSDLDVDLADEVAALLLAADDGDAAAERELADRYAADARLNPRGGVLCLSPTGTTSRFRVEPDRPSVRDGG